MARLALFGLLGFLFQIQSVWAASWEGKIVRTVETVPADLADQVNLAPGDRYRAETVRNLLTQRYATDLFRDIQVTITPLADDEIGVRFLFIRRMMLSSVAIFGNHSTAMEDIQAALGVRVGEEWTEARWTAASEAATDFFRKEGHFQATLIHHAGPIRGAPEGQVALDVRVREGQRARIRAAHFTGERVFSDLALSLRTRSHKGTPYRQVEVERDVERLRVFYQKRGYLVAHIGTPAIHWDARTNEVEITFPITAGHRIDLIFDGRGPFPLQKLQSQIGIIEARSDDNAVLEEGAQALAGFYRAHGYPFANVTFSTRRIPNENRTEARFMIQHGPRTRIRAIHFVGNRGVSKKRLRAQIQLKKEGRLRKSPYTEAQRIQDAEALERFYRREGFTRARVVSAAEFDARQENAIVRFQIDEGVRTRIGRVEIAGNTVLSRGGLIAPMPMGAPYHEEVVKAGTRHIQAAYARQGYLYATVEATARFSEDQAVADLLYTVNAGKAVRLGTLAITGHPRTKPHVLLREMRLRPGDLYQPEAILKSQRRLYRTGYFSAVRFEPVGIETQPDVLDVNLSVTERPHVPVEFGFGYGEHERMRGFFEIADRNIFGHGQEVRLRAHASGLEEKYTLSFQEPWIFSQNLNARFTLATGQQEEATYDLEASQATVGIEKAFNDTLKGTLQYQYERNLILARDPAAHLSPEDVGRLNIATINVSLIRDTRDDPFNPRKGQISGATLRNGARALGSEVQIVKLTLQHSGYRALSDTLILAASLRVGAAERFGETDLVPPTERFLLGGRNTVRGYETDRLGIRNDTLTPDGAPIGGNAQVLFNEELRVLLPNAWGLVFFLDHGNVWRKIRETRLSEIKSTIGLGLRYHTPVGPLRLDWGYKLDREEKESAAELHFTLGHAF